MTTTEPATYVTPATATIGAVETVRADQLATGDVLVLPDRVETIHWLATYNLASPIDDRVIQTSNPPHHRWPVIHILTGSGGFVRFPHEHVTRVAGS